MFKKAVIITEGGKDIGLGHITRSLSLYQALEEKGAKTKFIVNKDEIAQAPLGGQRYIAFNWLEEKKTLFDLIKDADIAVIDSYLAGLEFYTEVSEMVKRPLYIDDNKRLDYPRGIVVNGGVDAERLDYSKKDNVTYLLGSRYSLLRRTFWDIEEKRINSNLENVLITFGGTDRKRLTPKVLRLLAENYPDLAKKVIVGKGFKCISEIEEAKDKKTELIYFPEAQDMKNTLFESDIAISAGGQTLYELARVGVPPIAVIVTDNQAQNVEGWHKKGFAEYAGRFDDRELLSNVSEGIDFLQGSSERLRRSKIGKGLIDGRGPRRVVEWALKE